MSIIVIPDKYPGRCRNLRPERDVYGYPITVRCLEFEGERHVCRFPVAERERKWWHDSDGAISITFNPPPPQPWREVVAEGGAS